MTLVSFFPDGVSTIPASAEEPRARPRRLSIGRWTAELETGEISRDGVVRPVEPKVMDLLFLLASEPRRVFSKAEIFDRLWPDVTVGDGTLARSVSKLRKALGDDSRSPHFIETIPKRGYRLIADAKEPERAVETPSGRSRRLVPATLTAACLMAIVIIGFALAGEAEGEPSRRAQILSDRAADLYFQYRRADNEAAMELYERAIAEYPEHAPAQAGLSNVLVQKVLRWPNAANEPEVGHVDLKEAIRSGRTSTPEARRHLARALALASNAARLSPNDASVQRALGLVHAARSEFDEAITAYERAVGLDRNAWGALINLGDVHDLFGHDRLAVSYFEQAYDAMDRIDGERVLRVRPWQADLGTLIADRRAALGQLQLAEIWYRRVLGRTPFHAEATSGLANLLAESGDRVGATRLCREYIERAGANPGCSSLLGEG